MITRINWTDNYGNPRQDVVLSTFYYENRHYAVIAFNDFTLVMYDSVKTRFSTKDGQDYKDFYG